MANPLGTGIPVTSSFDVNTTKPLDSRSNVATTTDRNDIPATSRYVGLKVYVAADDKTYRLSGGILDANWTEDGGGGGAGGFTPTLVSNANYSILTTDQLVRVLATTQNVVLTLPAALAANKSVIRIKRIYNSNETYTITINRNSTPGTDTIEGATSETLPFNGNEITLVCSVDGLWEKYS